jgi:hypothetical protein
MGVVASCFFRLWLTLNRCDSTTCLCFPSTGSLYRKRRWAGSGAMVFGFLKGGVTAVYKNSWWLLNLGCEKQGGP